jgi:hypothetical protein
VEIVKPSRGIRNINEFDDFKTDGVEEEDKSNPTDDFM